jgi:hypothetical protein
VVSGSLSSPKRGSSHRSLALLDSLSVAREYLALRDGPRRFGPASAWRALLRYRLRSVRPSPTGLSPAVARLSRRFGWTSTTLNAGPSTPAVRVRREMCLAYHPVDQTQNAPTSRNTLSSIRTKGRTTQRSLHEQNLRALCSGALYQRKLSKPGRRSQARHHYWDVIRVAEALRLTLARRLHEWQMLRHERRDVHVYLRLTELDRQRGVPDR